MTLEHNGETFYQIVTHPKYYVSRSGNVYSTYKDRLLTPHNNGIGYMQVFLLHPDGNKWKKLHRLVATQFIPNPENYSDVNHKDMNKANNTLDNLEWCTRSYNQLHSFKNGRVAPRGQHNKRFGTKHSEETKAKQSQKKVGVNHPKFIGWYDTPLGRYASINAAASANSIDKRNVTKLCMIKHEGWEFIPK